MGWVHGLMCHGMFVEVRGQFYGLNSDHQVHIASVFSHWAILVTLFFMVYYKVFLEDFLKIFNTWLSLIYFFFLFFVTYFFEVCKIIVLIVFGVFCGCLQRWWLLCFFLTYNIQVVCLIKNVFIVSWCLWTWVP